MIISFFFFFNDTATTEIYTYGHTLSLHDALPISAVAPKQTAPAPSPLPRLAQNPWMARYRCEPSQPSPPQVPTPEAHKSHGATAPAPRTALTPDRKSTRLNSSH